MKTDPYKLAWNIVQATGTASKEVQELLALASDRGDPRATYAIASWLLREGAESRYQEAFHSLRSISQFGIKEALFDLAVCYHSGKGTRKNLRMAFRYYMLAALKGDEEACEEVANFFYFGVIVHRDKHVSAAWQEIADRIQEGVLAINSLPLDPNLELR